MAKLLSAGVLVRSDSGEIVLGHSAGTPYWDIPKGLVEAAETPLAAAKRELHEETGLILDSADWQDLGRHQYIRSKDLWLFLTPVLVPPPSPSLLSCTSQFTDRFGRVRLEFDAFRLARREALPALCAPSLNRLLQTLDW